MKNSESQENVQAQVDRFIKASTEPLTPEQAVYLVAVLVNRGAVELHRVARAAAAERKGTPEWGRWAALQNNARNLVLQSSTARDIGAQIDGHGR